jgi:hypothetical protein
MKDADVDGLIAFRSDELVSNEGILELRQSTVPFQNTETDKEIMVYPSPAKTLGIKRRVLVFQKAYELVSMNEEEDPNGRQVRRCAEFLKRSWHATKCYMKKRRRFLFNLSWTMSSLNSQWGTKSP